MACAWLAEALDGEPEIPGALQGVVDPRDWRNCMRLVEQGLGSPETTSMGRLFDAVGALCGAAPRVSYEGQAAVELEAMADPSEPGSYEIPFGDGVLDPAPAIRALVADLDGGGSPARIAARFHNAVAAATAAACSDLAAELGTEVVVLSGGVFQNRLLLERTVGLLAAMAFASSYPSAFLQMTEESASARLPSRQPAVPLVDAGSADLPM